MTLDLPNQDVSIEIYDNFSKPGYSLTDYAGLDSMRFGHGLFCLLDALPFQHPGAPELSVSIPAHSPPDPDAAGRARLFGQGVSGSIDNFTTTTISGGAEAGGPSELLALLTDTNVRPRRGPCPCSGP